MEQNFFEAGIADLRKYFPVKVADNLSNDFFVSEIRYNKELDMLKYPCRFNGYMAVFCIKGRFTMEIDLKRYEVSENSLVLHVPGNIVKVVDVREEDLDDFQFVAIATSRDFLTSAKLDFVRLFNEALSIFNSPCLHLTDEEMEIFKDYLSLCNDLASRDADGTRDAISFLLSSAFYYFGSIWKSRITKAQENHTVPATSRSRSVFEEFLKLVSENHTRERGMAFYADKLCLTPKYLSKVVRKVSGQSGPDWISSYVILEAKNLLKYSDMPIKEIVYRLNFPNSSVFYKFFKAHTGMTPSEYRR